MALEKQRVEMMGTSEERLAFEKEEQAAKRIEYLYKQSARRILNQAVRDPARSLESRPLA